MLLGLAFNTKTLAAFLAIPGIGLAYLICAPVSLWRRVWHLLVAGVVLAALSCAWLLAVDATPLNPCQDPE